MATTTVNEGERIDFTIFPGETYKHTFKYQDSSGNVVNLAGYNARLQMRASADASAFLYEATSSNGAFTVDGATGTVNLTIPASATSSWTWTTAVYDLELFSGSPEVVIKPCWGKVKLNPKEITR